jgi:nitrogen regulatory protein P-II 1
MSHDTKLLKIEAVVRNSKLHEVKEALKEIGIPSFSSYEVKIAGIHVGHISWRAHSRKVSDLIPKSKIEIICHEKDEEKIMETLAKAAHTGETGDGIVFVYSINKLLKIKNSAINEEAL